MLRKLDYSVTFSSTGRTLKEAVLFQRGLGAITGPNESGKSMILEMIRFSFFGSGALRGTADDYKTLKVSLEFDLKGKTYLIERTSTKAKLSLDGEVLATGIKPVNLKIIQMLGFNLDVFDMGCVANQDELLDLGTMSPTERRRRVDSVIGVAILDDLAKLAGDEALALKRAADDLSSNLHEPREPIAPTDYRPSVDLLAEKQKLDLVRSEADQLRGWLSNEKQAPVRPQDKIGMGSAVIQELLDAQTQRTIERQVLEAELARIPKLERVVTAEELDQEEERHRLANLYRARRQFLTYHSMPDLTQLQIDTIRAAWDAWDNWGNLKLLKIARREYLEQGHQSCPSCSHQWPLACDEIEKIDAKIAALEAKPLLEEAPTTKRAELDKQERILKDWLTVEDEWNTVHSHAPANPVETTMTVDQIVLYRRGLEGKARRDELVAQIEALKPSEKEPDYAAMLRERQQYEAQLEVWGRQVDEFEAWEKEWQEKTIKLTMLQMDLTPYPALLQAIEDARVYEAALVSFQEALESYNKLAGQVAAYRTDADDWKKVKDALIILRSKIKAYLVPSLNRVASSLLHHMTGGQRSTIAVDEDFNITVDGQSINTLSGSGKAVANLSLRIGLGQVLTNNIISIFMGDEIDASMDANRAEKTASVVYTLKDRISQLLLVSHKSPSADYYIALGENTGEHDTATTH